MSDLQPVISVIATFRRAVRQLKIWSRSRAVALPEFLHLAYELNMGDKFYGLRALFLRATTAHCNFSDDGWTFTHVENVLPRVLCPRLIIFAQSEVVELMTSRHLVLVNGETAELIGFQNQVATGDKLCISRTLNKVNCRCPLRN